MMAHSEGYRYFYEEGVSSGLSPCPGLYCARMKLPDGNFSGCGPCPRGFRRYERSFFECVPCDQELAMYDWLYLGFMALLPVTFHFASIDPKLLKHSKTTLGLVICALLEVLIAGCLTILFWEPVGKLRIHACGVVNLSDWYPIFYNPHPNYEKTLHCSHEAVYPLYTIILVFFAMADGIMLPLRLCAYFLGVKVAKSIYSGLYFYPILALGHLIFAGIFYYIFPYLTIVASVVSCAFHFAKRSNQNFKQLLLESLKDWRNVGVILCHWLLHGYGIISMCAFWKFGNWQRDLSLMFLVPIPAFLYVLTANFTDPDKIHGD